MRPVQLMRNHRDKVLAHAAARLVRSRPLSEPFDISGLFRTFVKLEDKRLKTSLNFGASACQVAAARSFVLDLVVESAYCEARFKEQVVIWLKGELALSDVERHVALMPDRYVRVTRPDAAATHLHLIEELKSDILALRWTRPGNASTELTICAQDRPGLFADIAGTLAAHGIEILAAELNTRYDGIALDVITLREAPTHHAIDVHRYAGIEASLCKAINQETDVAALVERWRTKNAPRKRVIANHARRRRRLPHVVCDNDSSRSSTLIEIQAPDETGLAFKIARELASLGLNIVCAKIATERSDALDVFYVNDEKGMKLQETVMQEVETVLTEKLSSRGSA